MKYLSYSSVLDFIDASPSCFHVIENIKRELDFCVPLNEADDWTLQPGRSYYVSRNDSSIIFFKLPDKPFKGIHIAAAHSDSPCFKIKPCPEMDCDKAYTKINVEPYGGMIMSSWFDRPLSAAGRLIVNEFGKPVSKTVNADRDLFIIPNVAVHMNRKINEGYSYNAQTDLLPLFGGKDAKLLPVICECAGVDPESVLGSDLFLYPRTKGTVWGRENEFISSRALDDLQCVYGILKGFSESDLTFYSEYISMGCIFNNEETGSLSRQGADSTFLEDVIGRINECFDISKNRACQIAANSFMISADNAHAVHPNHPDLSDPTNRPHLNGGIVLKYNAAQKYTTDGYSEAYLRSICKNADVPVQTYTNRSDIAGGSTLGNLSNRHFSVSTADIGLPQLAMHSAYETAGAKDTEYLIRIMKEFFSA